MFSALFSIIPWKRSRYSRIIRINLEKPKSNTAKNTAEIATVVTTVIV